MKLHPVLFILKSLITISLKVHISHSCVYKRFETKSWCVTHDLIPLGLISHGTGTWQPLKVCLILGEESEAAAPHQARRDQLCGDERLTVIEMNIRQ